MHLTVGRPVLLRAAAPAVRAQCCRMDVLDDLKYQLSNADPESRPARDLVENPVAAAYLVVLAILGGGLAYLLYLDTQATAKREAALKEQMEAAEMLRAQGLVKEASVLDSDLKRESKPPKPAPQGMQPQQGNVFAEDLGGNRFERRQGRAAKRSKGKKRRKTKS